MARLPFSIKFNLKRRGRIMASKYWPTRLHPVTNLHLDAKNPRLGRETTTRAPREVIQYLFDHDKAIDVAESIARRGFFANEPLLAVKENDQIIVLEGNRRLAALKGLRKPELLSPVHCRKLERLAKLIENPKDLGSVPVTLAPSRRATDKQIAGRHVGSPVLAWQAENRASFILDKLQEGYTDDQIRAELQFTAADIQAARQTRAIADMARSLELPENVRAKLDNPRVKLFTTIERVFSSSVGRSHLMIQPDPDHGIRVATSKAEFTHAFSKLVADVALGKVSSRTLNSNENIDNYFKKWSSDDLPRKRKRTFVPSDVIKGESISTFSSPSTSGKAKQNVSSPSKSVIPRNFKVRFGNDRLKEIRNELVKLKREDFPNAGAVLLRVFLELAIQDYLIRKGELPKIVDRIEKKSKKKIPYSAPNLKELVPEVKRIAKKALRRSDAAMVEKALRYDKSAPFSISELHGFVHQPDLPSSRDIEQFWKRTEPLFRLMLEQDCGGDIA